MEKRKQEYYNERGYDKYHRNTIEREKRTYDKKKEKEKYSGKKEKYSKKVEKKKIMQYRLPRANKNIDNIFACSKK